MARQPAPKWLKTHSVQACPMRWRHSFHPTPTVLHGVFRRGVKLGNKNAT
jgi:hypothetical protein